MKITRLWLLAGLILPITYIGLDIVSSLEPTVPPDELSMKTLVDVPPARYQTPSGPERFELVLDGEAVLDKETGFIWEKSAITAYVWSVLKQN